MPARFDQLPTDPDTLRALLLAERKRHADELAAAHGEVERLIGIIKELQRYRFGRRAERLERRSTGARTRGFGTDARCR